MLERPKIDKPQGDIPFDLGLEEIIVGQGEEATKSKKVSVHYTTTIANNPAAIQSQNASR